MRRHEAAPAQTAPPRVSDLAAEWLAANRTTASRTWLYRVELALRVSILPLLGHRMAEGLTVPDLEAWRRARRAAGASVTKSNAEITVLGVLFASAVRTGRIQRSPLQPGALRRLPGSRGRLVYFSREEWAAFCAAAPLAADARERRQLHLATLLFRGNLLTATRIGEAMRLTTDDVLDGRIRVFQTKVQRVKFIPITPPLAALLEDCQAARGGPAGPLFPGSRGAWSKSHIHRSFHRLLELAGITRPGLVVHSIRHTAASWLAISGAPLRTIQEIAGHGSITSTLRYAHLSPEHLAGHLAVLG